MAPTRELLDKTTRLKRDLLDFAESPPLKGEVDRQLRALFGVNPPRDEAEFAFTMDSLLLDHRYSSGKTLVDHYVAAKPKLSPVDRAMVLSWRNARKGVLRVDAKEAGALLTYNLADDLTYRIYSNSGTAFTDQIAIGMFLLARIVPLENDWLFSGGQIPIPADHIDLAYETALKMIDTTPAVVFQNPRLLETAWDLQRQEHAQFIEFFGSDIVVFRRQECVRRMDDYMHWRVHKVRDNEGKTAADRSREQGHPVNALPPLKLPENMKNAETIGAIYDDLEGLMLFPELGDVAAIFADPSLLEDEDQRETVVDYLEDPDIIPLPLKRLAERNPEHATRIFQTILEEPAFEWARDGEAMLRDFKPFTSQDAPLPSIHPIPEGLSDYQAKRKTTGHTGRNDPCPCGSGRKFKHCHGKNAR